MKKTEWWDLFDKNKPALRDLVAQFHPTSGQKHDMPITASGAEAACEMFRNQILQEARVPGLAAFDAAAEVRDSGILASVLNEAWFGMPESSSVRSLPGFFPLCDLCEGIDPEDEEAQPC